jgi:hypothetical protein
MNRKAILRDVDGTPAETEEVHQLAFNPASASVGRAGPPHRRHLSHAFA